jgi:hypothetical protein
MTSPPLSPRQAVTAFIKRIEQLDREKNAYDKFRDFCELAYCALAKQTAAEDRAQRLEDRYMQIVGTYRNKDTVRAYPELLAIAAGAIAQGGCDFLGSAATQMEVLNAGIGQFFTPYDVSRMIAEMTLQDAGPLIEANGFVTVSEPASGAGGMVLAAADALQQQGFDPSLHMLVNAVDLSPLCYHMTFLQLSLRGIPALVEHANSLSVERFERAWTPAAVPFYARHRKLFPAAELKDVEPPAPRVEPTPISGDGFQFDLFEPAA